MVGSDIQSWKNLPQLTPEILANIRSRFKDVPKTEQKANPTQKSGTAAMARMMAPGITVVYQIDAADRKERKCALPWGIGVCDLVNQAQNNFFITHCSLCTWRTLEHLASNTWEKNNFFCWSFLDEGE